MKVTAFVGSARKKHTYLAVQSFLEKLKLQVDIEYEIVVISNYNLKICKGCKLCIDNGEELCPLKDDRDILMNKIMESDGVVFASPNYSFQVSGQMKVFLDRFGYLLHRPQFFGKTFTCIVTQGIYGGKDIVKYLDFVGRSLGFNVVKGLVIKTLEPISEAVRIKANETLENQSRKFFRQLVKKKYPSPSLLKLMLFRLSRTSIKMILNDDFRDFRYFSEHGWFNNDYYYPVRLNLFKKTMGRLFDHVAGRIAV